MSTLEATTAGVQAAETPASPRRKILFLSPYFPPEMGAPSARVSELARHWVQAGHEVTVLTAFPNQPSGVVPPEYRRAMRRLLLTEDYHGARVERTWLIPTPNRKPWERIANYSSYCVSALLRGLFLSRPEVIIATSPQMLAAVAGLWLAKLRRVPFIFEVRDLWPESLVGVGLAGRTDPLYRLVGKLAGMLYRYSDHVVVVSPAFKDYLHRNWSVPLERMSIVVNGVEPGVFSPGEPNEQLLGELGLAGKFVVSYIGMLGSAHGVSTVLEAAALLRHRPEIAFLLVGAGAERDRIEDQVREQQLDNLKLLPQQPRSAVPGLIASSKACLVVLRDAEVFKTVIPTKMLEFMSCGRPVVVAVQGQAQEIVEAAQAGICVPPENPGALAAAIERLYGDEAERERMGRNGRSYIVSHMSREQTAHEYLKVIERVVEAAQPPRVPAHSGVRSEV
jgi:glycosyltransferase involved in cell wall biosynthesis